MSVMATFHIDQLVAMNDEDFRSVVDDAIRGQTDEHTIAMLRAPSLVERTYLVLVSIKKNVEGQLAAKKADYIKTRALLHGRTNDLREAEEKYQSWRAGALRFKSGVEEMMAAVRASRTRRESFDENYYLAYQTLRQAILQHRDHVCDEDCDAECTADATLWNVAEDMPG